MSQWDQRPQKSQRDPSEGVRIIGADEAAEALEREDIGRRLGDDEPRFGDRPSTPPSDGPRPALRFPLAGSDDLATFERPAAVPVQPRTEAPELSHWAGSAAEEVPNMSRRDPREVDDAAWNEFMGPGPRWRDDAPVEQPTMAQPGEWPPPDPRMAPTAAPPGPPEPPVSSGGYSDEIEPPPGRSVFGDVADDAPVYDDGYEDEYAQDAYADDGYADEAYEDEYYEDEPAETGYAGVPPAAAAGQPAEAPPGQRTRGGRQAQGPARGADRDLRTAVGVGLGIAVLALALLFFAGPLGGMLLVLPIVGYAAYEYMLGVHEAGWQPLLPVGVVAAVGSVLAAYNYGEGAIPLVLVLTVAVCFLWYLVSAGGDRPAGNIGITLLGVVWIGTFGSFAGLLLAGPLHGAAYLLAAVVPTVAYDVGGLFVGRSAGSRPLSAASPNKTVEGLAGGMFLALAAGAVYGAVGPVPFDGLADGLKIGLVAALAAPIGDLAESLIKRDLAIKDMGSLLPGHGGVLDRFDALLFVLPAVWYLLRVSDFFLP